MTDLQLLADRVELTALQAEFTDAGMQRDFDRVASLFTEDGAWRMPHIPAEFTSRAAIRAAIGRLQELWAFFVQNAHPGTVEIDGDTARGRVYIVEFGRMHEGGSHLNYAIYHDRYRRTPDGWRFTERVYEIRYMDTTPLPGAPPVS
jgi:ketosteroid isomerase-like protein